MGRDTIGRLRRRLVVEVPQEVPDGAGGVVRTFVQHAIVWAEVEALKGDFRLAQDRAAQRATHRITLRAGLPLSAETRLRDGTRIHQLHSVHTADTENRFLVALTEELTG